MSIHIDIEQILSEAIETPKGLMLPRRPAGQYVHKKYGFGSSALLAKLAMTPGAGPLFYRFRGTKKSLYPIPGLDEWALAQFGEARTSFSKTEVA